MSLFDGPGGWVVIEFAVGPSEVCTWPQCPMTATWFATFEEADAYMERSPRWTEPHRLPLTGPPGLPPIG
jgi:hypothetical protein